MEVEFVGFRDGAESHGEVVVDLVDLSAEKLVNLLADDLAELQRHQLLVSDEEVAKCVPSDIFVQILILVHIMRLRVPRNLIHVEPLAERTLRIVLDSQAPVEVAHLHAQFLQNRKHFVVLQDLLRRQFRVRVNQGVQELQQVVVSHLRLRQAHLLPLL